MIIKTPKTIVEANALFSKDQNKVGSYERLSKLLLEIPQNVQGKVKYLISGSWSIEFISGNKMEDHRDIDIISISEPPFYFDDALSTEEHCCEVIPLPKDYFKKRSSILVCKNMRDNGFVYTPNVNLQLCFKLIGALSPTLSDRQISQLISLLKTYKQIQQKDTIEIIEILSSCLPESLNFKELSENISKAILLFIKNEEIKSIELLKEVHHKINVALQEEFKNMSWNEYERKNKGIHNC